MDCAGNAGAPDSDARVTKIEVFLGRPPCALAPHSSCWSRQYFSDGHTADVTRWAKFDSGDEGVATVDNNGRVTMHSYGEAPVTVWYQSHVTFARLRIPFPWKLEDAVFLKAPATTILMMRF